MGSESDRKLVEVCRRGSHEAYAELVNLHAGRVYAVCLGILGSAADAEDLTQEALVQGYLKINELRDPDRFGAWIAATAANLSRNLLQRQANREQLLERGEDVAAAAHESFPDLERALAKLPEKHRIPLMLYYFDSRSAESIAASLDISPGAVRMRLSRARAELRALLEEAEANDERRMH